MARKRTLTMITLSVIMGVVAAWMAGNLIVNANKEAEIKMASVVAADLAIPFGTKVEKRHLKMLEMPAEYVPPGSYGSFEAVIDRVTVQPIVAGEILMQGRFVDYDDGSTLAAMVSKKMRAVTVRVDDVIGVAGFLLPGNRVDVLAARRLGGGSQRATTETILRNIKVLAVDQTAAAEKNEPVIVRAVTLEVAPEQAEDLFKAREEGSILLTLRNPLEEEPLMTQTEPEPEPEPVAAPAPAPRPVAAPRPRPRSRSHEITVIRGTAVTESKTNS
jgi:pilus assembly protein CpaB